MPEPVPYKVICECMGYKFLYEPVKKIYISDLNAVGERVATADYDPEKVWSAFWMGIGWIMRKRMERRHNRGEDQCE